MRLKRFSVSSQLPAALEPLQLLANNFWWSWNHDATQLFMSIHPENWEEVYHNPIKQLRTVSQNRLQELAEDQNFLKDLGSVMARFNEYIETTDSQQRETTDLNAPIAYFSAEFGLHESLPVYSGGLGILAGDHCKSASDVALPLVGVGLLYKSGYFIQRLTIEGVQEASYNEHDFESLPIRPVFRGDGQELRIYLDIAGRQVAVKCWQVQVGRIALYLMDTDLPENDADAQQITSLLYGGGVETRIAQEMLLGIGGVRMLKALGIAPTVFHINEGHAAFLGLERLHNLMQESQLSFEEARNVIAAEQVFTTHTPVPAGHDRFDRGLVERFLGATLHQMGLDFSQLWNLGAERQADGQELFCMTILALNTSRCSNGVSELHGKVSRQMWKKLWPEVPEDELPIGHITNGIHSSTWLGAEMAALLEETLGKDWQQHKIGPELWDKLDGCSDRTFWQAHLTQKERLVEFVRGRIHAQRTRFQEPVAQREAARTLLDPNVLTIGFARRFAPYKRATLLFRDPERLRRILNDPERPVQVVFAGKSHPHNQEGKDLLRDVYQFSRTEGFEGKIIFVEDYDANVGRHLVQGVDVWLNNPIRPQEASGTSGQKVPLNGGLNFSILDGWWVEGYQDDNGWSIGGGVEYDDRASQDYVDSRSLYETLEEQIVPLYYQRDEDGLPSGWIQRMRKSMQTVVPVFNTRRMVLDYLKQMYEPAARLGQTLRAEQFARARQLTQWKDRVNQGWNTIQLQPTRQLPHAQISVGDDYTIETTVQLGDLRPEDVRVELYIGHLDIRSEATLSACEVMQQQEELEPNTFRYTAKLSPKDAGEYGYNIRIVPHHPDLMHPHEMGLIHWA